MDTHLPLDVTMFPQIIKLVKIQRYVSAVHLSFISDVFSFGCDLQKN